MSRSTCKPIETHYKGRLFRSRLEARWAVFFETTGIEYAYELEGYDLGGLRYLPDFWLPQVQMWAEVKAGKLSEAETVKLQRLVQATRHGGLELVGEPDFHPYRGWWLWDEEVPATLAGMDFVLLPYYARAEHRFWFEPAGAYESEEEFPALYHEGVYAARAERFGVHDGPAEEVLWSYGNLFLVERSHARG
jgi:hypothetical protein